MGDKEMLKPKVAASCAFALIVALLITSGSTSLVAATVSKSITAMEDGRYMIKLRVTASDAAVYALKLGDPQAAIIDVYAPKGWCVVTDSGDYLARTGSKPIAPGKTLEFLIHSSTEEINYTYSVFGRLKQLGKPGTI